MKSKWIKLTALLAGGSVVLQSCLGDFVDGLFNTGWPTDNRWINIAIDVIKEDVFL